MKKIELLVPVGNKEMLLAAIHNGADAVYLSGKNFGARAYATNFTNEELKEAINFSHLYGVKVYVTVNTLIKETEINQVLEYATFLHKIGVDALIMQDLGLINLIHQVLPNLEIHASTQCHTTNDASLEFLKKIGCKRAVLAREMTLTEIKNLTCDIEREIFIHGALCISYSGECLFSSYVLNRSGNRGECAGMCRLPYEAYDENKKIETKGKYLLSPKELCTIPRLKDILNLNIHSLKIEGRMKSPLYVAYTTKLYRKYIDAFYNNEDMTPTEEEIKILKVLYNREFTLGHLFEEQNLINSKSPNHIGYKIGKVKSFNEKKIQILLSQNVKQGDAIKFLNNNLGMYLNFIYDENNRLINQGLKDHIIYLDNKIHLNSLDDVYLTYDSSLESILNNKKKIPIEFLVKAKINEPLEITISDYTNKITLSSDLVESAQNNPTNKEVIKEKLNKTKDTPLVVENIKFELSQNIFIRMTTLNNLRRELIEKLIVRRTEVNNTIEIKTFNKTKSLSKVEFQEIKIIHTEKQYEKNPTICFYTENYTLYNKFKENKNIYLILPRVSRNIKYKNEYLVVNNTADLFLNYQENTIHTGIYMNVYNSYTIDLLQQYNVSVICISPEIKDLETFENLSNISYFDSGILELMIIKNNIFPQKTKEPILVDRNKEKYLFLKKNNYFALAKFVKCRHNKDRIKLIRIKEELE